MGVPLTPSAQVKKGEFMTFEPALCSSADDLDTSKDQAALFHMLVESLHEYAFYMIDSEGFVVSWNQGAELHKGYARNEIIGKHYRMFFGLEGATAGIPERCLEEASIKGRAVSEGWRVHKNGNRVWAEMVATTLRGAEGELRGFAILTRDLTARKRQEDAMRAMEAALRRERDQLMEERDRFLAVAESSLDALYICQAVYDEQGEVVDFIFTYLNSNVEKMVLIPRSEMLGQRMCEVLPINRTTGLFERYKAVMKTGIPLVEEMCVQHRDVMSEWIRLQAVRMRGGLAITASDITSRKHDESRMRHMMQHDPLTGVSNRSVMQDRADLAIKRARRNKGRMGVLAIDLDEFKQINDTYGHLCGDGVLFTVANRLQTALRETDTVIRMGGDEFIVIVSDMNTIDDLSTLANRLLAVLEAPILIEDQAIKATCSVGIAAFPEHGSTFPELLLSADGAMYTAKRAGRNRGALPEGLLARTTTNQKREDSHSLPENAA